MIINAVSAHAPLLPDIINIQNSNTDAPHLVVAVIKEPKPIFVQNLFILIDL